MMSETRRAFHALEGKTFPQVGARGRYVHTGGFNDAHRYETDIEVVGVTASGKTLSVRFVDQWARTEFESETFRVYRRGEGHDGSGWYLPHGRSGLHGEVMFSSDPRRR